MADRVKQVTYCYAKVPSRSGQGVKYLADIKKADLNLIAFSGFPIGAGKAQLDFVTDDMTGLRKLARKKGWQLSANKKGFHVQGKDAAGAVHRHVRTLADIGISIVAADAVCAGKGRYGMIMWVKPRDYARAARALGAKK